MPEARSAMPAVDSGAALDPARSCVVAACAGSGKTWQLASRMLRLLLAGAEPGSILALTFTRKAAQEMRERLESWLARLSTADDAWVLAFLAERGVAGAEAHAALPLARVLHERVMAAEPTLAIDTFHGWFLRIVSLAPLSPPGAGAPARVALPHGAVLVEQAGALVAQAWQRFAAALGRAPGAPATLAFERILARLGLENTRKALLACVGRRAEWWAFTDGQADPAAFAAERLRAALGVDPHADPAHAFFVVERERLLEYANLLARNELKADLEAADALHAHLEAARFDATALAACGRCWLKKDGEPRAPRKAAAAQARRLGAIGEARLLELHAALGEAFGAAHAALQDQATCALNADIFVCLEALVETLQGLKATRALADFTDIEWLAAQALTRADHAAYLHARLDARYRHLLLDEFQDTNPLQWAALQGWLAAYGDDGQRPTVLMVGDPKQSIYRFRRADARLFDAAGDWLAGHWAAQRVERNDTWRNAAPVVDVVNRVFDGLAGFGHFSPQTTHQKSLPGRVEVLPLVRRADRAVAPRDGALRNPLIEARAEARDERRLEEGRRLAARLAGLIGRMRVPDAGGTRAARFGDVMILARRRAAFVEIEAALREARMPFASARGGGLLDALEVADMLAVLAFIATPGDDLKLAHALKSPLLGATDDDLIRLAGAAGREVSWWRRLDGLAAPSPALARARALLGEWLALAEILPVHDLLDRIYHQGDAHARYAAAVPVVAVARVLANLDALIALALEQDAGRFPSLLRFLDELKAAHRGPGEEAPDEGEADAFAAGDAIRLMTVHGAKGLEAPIVCLVDANGAAPRGESREPLIAWPPEAAVPTHFSFLTGAREIGRGRVDVLAAGQAAAAREELNLLYVAMTRAQQVLLISGSENRQAAAGSAWQLVRAAVDAEAGTTTDADAVAAHGALETGAPASSAAARGEPDGAAPASEPAPTAIGSRRAAETPGQRDGVLLHAALQWLAEARDARHEAPDDARLARLCGVRADAIAPLRARAAAAMAAPELVRFFDPAGFVRAHNEYDLIGPAGSRRLDRVVEFASEVWVLDYKRSLGAADLAAYQTQVRDYMALLAPLHPGRRVLGALIDVRELRLVPVVAP